MGLGKGSGSSILGRTDERVKPAGRPNQMAGDGLDVAPTFFRNGEGDALLACLIRDAHGLA